MTAENIKSGSGEYFCPKMTARLAFVGNHCPRHSPRMVSLILKIQRQVPGARVYMPCNVPAPKRVLAPGILYPLLTVRDAKISRRLGYSIVTISWEADRKSAMIRTQIEDLVDAHFDLSDEIECQYAVDRILRCVPAIDYSRELPKRWLHLEDYPIC